MDKENYDCIPSYLKFSPAYNYINSNKIKIPTKLNKHDSSCYIKVSDDGLKIVYNGPGLSYIHVGAIRANHHVPPEVGLFYYEMDVIDKGTEGYIGLGFCEPDIQLNRMPGWDFKSYGYHGDDGYKFASQSRGSLGEGYGPLFTSGDTIGVGINFFNDTIFFTKNGIHLGTAFTNVKSSVLYPMIGMRSLKECIVVNFGQKQFVFDIDKYAQKIHNEILDDVDDDND
ncbi:concanavalin A-like lectin/glucanase domain-containing protein [Glomus cerebriforme]|uniref:Concanavalin A-like lectin/glucanase domain-containing protein n=1 Tax=Glomus cerebriforme TaxID=658196 RepID=A0A397TLQ1_9GLOM|nr:concanavalin A-like lectin/glucanase domain-containing protein [Glomus cerebriforme]